MSAAAAGAAGRKYIADRGPSQHEIDVEADRLAQVICPFCDEHFHRDSFEFHLFIAHKCTEAKP